MQVYIIVLRLNFNLIMKTQKYIQAIVVVLFCFAGAAYSNSLYYEPFSDFSVRDAKSGGKSGSRSDYSLALEITSNDTEEDNNGKIMLRAFPGDDEDTGGINLGSEENIQKYVPIGGTLPLFFIVCSFCFALFVRHRRNQSMSV